MCLCLCACVSLCLPTCLCICVPVSIYTVLQTVYHPVFSNNCNSICLIPIQNFCLWYKYYGVIMPLKDSLIFHFTFIACLSYFWRLWNYSWKCIIYVPLCGVCRRRRPMWMIQRCVNCSLFSVLFAASLTLPSHVVVSNQSPPCRRPWLLMTTTSNQRRRLPTRLTNQSCQWHSLWTTRASLATVAVTWSSWSSTSARCRYCRPPFNLLALKRKPENWPHPTLWKTVSHCSAAAAASAAAA